MFVKRNSRWNADMSHEALFFNKDNSSGCTQEHKEQILPLMKMKAGSIRGLLWEETPRSRYSPRTRVLKQEASICDLIVVKAEGWAKQEIKTGLQSCMYRLQLGGIIYFLSKYL